MWSDDLLLLNPNQLMTVFIGFDWFETPIEELLNMTIHPRISQSVMVGEDKDIPRISMAPTFKQCLEGITGKRLLQLWEDYGEYEEYIPLVAFSFNPQLLNHKALLNPSQLDKAGYVPDAYLSNEFWYLDSVNPVEVFKVKLLDAVSEDGSYDIMPREFRSHYNSEQEFYDSDEFDRYVNNPLYWATTFTYIADIKYEIVEQLSK